MASVTVNDYMPIIWNRLMTEFQNEKGVAGIMGNLYAESGCTSYACQPTRPYNICMIYIDNLNNHRISRNDFIYHGCSASGGVSDGQLGFGLAQWTFYSRKEGFYDYMFANGNDIADLENQIAYVIEEITSDSTMDSIVRNATDIDSVSDYILIHYENPKDQSIEMKKLRRGYSGDIYDTYNGTTPVEPTNPQPPSHTDTPIPQEPVLLGKGMPLWMMLKNRHYT